MNGIYPAKLKTTRFGGVIASFRDVPEAKVESDAAKVAEDAKDALLAAMELYIEEGREFPEPSNPKKGELPIKVPPSVLLKVILHNAMIEQNIRPADLARLMRVRPQEVTRITNLRHATKVDTMADALYAIGKVLTVSVK